MAMHANAVVFGLRPLECSKRNSFWSLYSVKIKKIFETEWPEMHGLCVEKSYNSVHFSLSSQRLERFFFSMAALPLCRCPDTLVFYEGYLQDFINFLRLDCNDRLKDY